MTETTTTTAPAVRQRIVGGVLSDIQRSSENGVTAVTATLTTTFQGRVTVRRLTVADDVLATVDPLLVEGPVVKFYATVSETDVIVLGPDLTQRPVASTPAPAAKPTKPKRPQTPAQKKAWAEVILPASRPAAPAPPPRARPRRPPRPRPPTRWSRPRNRRGTIPHPDRRRAGPAGHRPSRVAGSENRVRPQTERTPSENSSKEETTPMAQSFEIDGFTISRRVDGVWFMMETATRLSIGIIPGMCEGDARTVARLIAVAHERGARRERCKLGILGDEDGRPATAVHLVSRMGRGSFATLVEHAIRGGIYQPQMEKPLLKLATLAETKAGSPLGDAISEMLAFAITIDEGKSAGPRAQDFDDMVKATLDRMDRSRNPIFFQIPIRHRSHEALTAASILDICQAVVDGVLMSTPAGTGSFASLVKHAIGAGIYRPKAEMHLRMLARLAESKLGTPLGRALDEMLAFAVTIDEGKSVGPEAEGFTGIVKAKRDGMDPFSNPVFVRIPAPMPSHETITVAWVLELCKRVVAESA